MAKRISKINFIIVSVLIAVGMVISFCQFNKLPGGSTNKFVGFINAITLNYDIGTSQTAVYNVTPVSDNNSEATSQQMNNAKEFLQQLLSNNNNGFNSIAVQENNKLRVEIIYSASSASLLEALANRVEIVIRAEDTANETAYDITSKNIVSATPSYQQVSDSQYSFGVMIQFDKTGKQMFEKLTNHAASGGQSIYFYSTDGTSIASLSSITKADTTGKTFLPKSDIYTEQDAIKYAMQVQLSKLDVKLKVEENSVTSSTLGLNIAFYIIISLAIAVVVLLVLFVIKYKDLGLLAMLSLFINIIIYLFFLQALPISTLSLSGVVGAVLGFCLTLFGHVIVFERIKKEFSSGRRIPLAVKLGFKNSMFLILDITALTFLSSLVLYLFGFEMIKSFALSVMIGALLTSVSVLLLTRTFAKWYLKLNSTKANKLALKEGVADED